MYVQSATCGRDREERLVIYSEAIPKQLRVRTEEATQTRIGKLRVDGFGWDRNGLPDAEPEEYNFSTTLTRAMKSRDRRVHFADDGRRRRRRLRRRRPPA